MLLLWFAALLLLLFFVYYRWGYAPYQVFKKMNIPGPPPLPFFGNILPMLFREERAGVIAEWCQEYGPVCGIFCGTWPGLSITDPAMIQQIFVTNFRHFTDRCKMSLMNTQATGLPPGIFECYPNEWKKIRHITLPAFTNAKLRKMSHHLEKSCSALLDRMLAETSTTQSIDIIEVYKDFVLEVTVLAVLGQEVRLQRGEGQDFKRWMELGYKISHGKILPSVFNLPTDLMIGFQFPWFVKLLYWLGPGQYLPAFRNLKSVIGDCITKRKHRTQTEQLQETCVLDLLVAACGAEEEQFSDDEILSHCINFLFAAYDTTSLTLTCATHLLTTHTHVQDKLCALLDDYWSQHQEASVFTTAQEVPYLDMVINETLRLYSPSPSIPRVCTEDTEVCGIHISKGMNIMVPVHYLHRIKSIWGDPDVFRPERFEREESASRPPCSYMPMGLGPRNCVGLKLGKLLMKFALVSLLRRHRFTRTHRTVDVLQTECYSATLCLKSGVFLTLQPKYV